MFRRLNETVLAGRLARPPFLIQAVLVATIVTWAMGGANVFEFNVSGWAWIGIFGMAAAVIVWAPNRVEFPF